MPVTRRSTLKPIATKIKTPQHNLLYIYLTEVNSNRSSSFNDIPGGPADIMKQNAFHVPQLGATDFQSQFDVKASLLQNKYNCVRHGARFNGMTSLLPPLDDNSIHGIRWIWPSSGMLSQVVWQTFTDVSEVLCVSIIRAINILENILTAVRTLNITKEYVLVGNFITLPTEDSHYNISRVSLNRDHIPTIYHF